MSIIEAHSSASFEMLKVDKNIIICPGWLFLMASTNIISGPGQGLDIEKLMSESFDLFKKNVALTTSSISSAKFLALKLSLKTSYAYSLGS